MEVKYLINISITNNTMKTNNENYAKTLYPWEFVEDKTNLWRKYTLEECGLDKDNEITKLFRK